MSLVQDERSSQAPTFRLLALGPSNSGKTTRLQHLVHKFGSWDARTSTAKLTASQARFSLREVPTDDVFCTLAQRSLLLDGVILFCDLSLPLSKKTLSQLHFAYMTHIPLRMIVATHCEAFAGEQAILDECEHSLREELSSIDISTNAIPIIHSDVNDSHEEECIERLQALDWGAPFTERPLLMRVSKARDVTRSESIADVLLLRGTARPQTPIEALCWGRRSLRGTIVSCSQGGIEQPTIKAPNQGEVRVSGVHPTPGAILSVELIKSSAKGGAQLFVYPRGAKPQWIPYGFSRELFGVSGDFLQEKVWLSPPREFFFTEGVASSLIELEVDSPSFLFRGLHFEWSYNGYTGGGVVTEVHP